MESISEQGALSLTFSHWLWPQDGTHCLVKNLKIKKTIRSSSMREYSCKNNSVSDPDLNRSVDPDSESGSGSRRQKLPPKIEKNRNFPF
jgi:hypothetical protein